MSSSLVIQGLHIHIHNHKTRTVTLISSYTKSAVQVPIAHSVDKNRKCHHSVSRINWRLCVISHTARLCM